MSIHLALLKSGLAAGLFLAALSSAANTQTVLPELCAALGIEHSHLEPGTMLVIHRANGRVLAVEKPE